MQIQQEIDEKYGGFVYRGETKLEPPFLESHRHRELELNLVCAGQISYLIGDTIYELPRGTLVWLLPGQEHQLIDRSDDASYYVATFRPEVSASFASNQEFRPLFGSPANANDLIASVLQPKDYHVLVALLDSLMAEGPPNEKLNREVGYGVSGNFTYYHKQPDVLRAGLCFLIARAWSFHRAANPYELAMRLHPAVSKALQLFDAGTAPARLSELAAECGASASYLSRLFHRQVGTTLSRYRSQLELQQVFREVYTHRNLTLAQALEKSGFGSYAQFYRVFKSVYQCGPREFARRNGGKLPQPTGAFSS